LGDNRFRIDNPPWFVRDLAVNDIVEAAAASDDQHPVFTRMIQRSEHVTIRIICLWAGPLNGNLRKVADIFTPLGICAEGFAKYGMVALDIPPDAPLTEAYRRLVSGQRDGSWEWEESRITPAWTASKS
jgi:hypothetical protein